jgi:hypothetical protein
LSARLHGSNDSALRPDYCLFGWGHIPFLS